MNGRRNILTTKLTQLQLEIWQNWLQSIDKLIVVGLAQHVITRDDSGGDGVKTLQMNFSPELFILLKEAKYLLAMQRLPNAPPFLASNFTETSTEDYGNATLPKSLLELYESRNEFWQRRIKLIKISEYYNGIREDVRPGGEMQLIRMEIDVIDECIDEACRTLRWRQYGEKL